MKTRLIYALLLTVSICACTRAETGKSAREAPGKDDSRQGILNEEQLAGLVTAHTDAKSGRAYGFKTSFGVKRLDPRRDRVKIGRYRESGRVPYRITAELSEYKEYKGRRKAKRLNGTAHIYVLAEDGKLVDREDVALSTLCPG